MSANLKKLITISCLLLFTVKVLGPGSGTLVIIYAPPAEPFKRLIHAIGKVETAHDTLAYNPVEKAVGYFQIRPIRLQDYNERTGSNYLMSDLFNYKISEKIFLYYASQFGPYNFENIARNWNGSGKRTTQYWKQVRKYL